MVNTARLREVKIESAVIPFICQGDGNECRARNQQNCGCQIVVHAKTKVSCEACKSVLTVKYSKPNEHAHDANPVATVA